MRSIMIRLVHSLSYIFFCSHTRLMASVSPFFVLPVIRQMIKWLSYANKGKWWMTLEHLLQILYYVVVVLFFSSSVNDDAWEMMVWRIDVICQIDEFYIMNFCKTLFSFKFKRRNCFEITSNSKLPFWQQSILICLRLQLHLSSFAALNNRWK